VVAEPNVKHVIKFKTKESWGFAPLPETTFKLITNGAEDKVQIVHTAGRSKKSITIKVPTGTYNDWIEKLTAVEDGQQNLDSMRVEDGSMENLWFVSKGKKSHLHWMGSPPEEMRVINDLTIWLHQLKLGMRLED